jgi:methionyl-tRNA formyltransferase
MRIDAGLDTGDMLLQRQLPIGPDQTSEDLYPLLAQMGAEVMVETLAGLEAGTLPPRKQDDSLATLAPILTREDGRMDFTRAATELYNRWRGFQPWPGAYAFLSGKKLTVHRMRIAARLSESVAPGQLLLRDGLFVACGGGSWLELVEVQAEGRKRMPASEFLRGFTLHSGDRLE